MITDPDEVTITIFFSNRVISSIHLLKTGNFIVEQFEENLKIEIFDKRKKHEIESR